VAAAPAVELRGIVKRFPGVVANRDIELSVATGEVHAIVGENGAGKSTLMKILYGMLRPDEGSISVQGHDVAFRSPTDAIAAGIGMVHQHFMLADNLTVLENVVLGAEPRKGITLDADSARARIRELGAAYGLEVDPDRRVEDLGVGDRQRVEILKVLYRGARILILDEPTAVLVPSEVAELFGNLAELKAQGVTILFISHKLDEVLEVADAITVIRAGTTVTTVDPKEVTARQLAELMVGSELPTPETRESTVTDRVVLSVRDVSMALEEERPILEPVAFDIHAGEILGVAGVEGNGQTELIEALMGVQRSSGTILLDGEDISRWSTRRRREAGLGYIPQDRHRNGLLLEAPLWENAALGHQTRRPYRRGPWIDRRGARAATEEIVREYDVRTPSIDVPALALSGGNQQKLIVGREMEAEPKVLIAAHPTRGVDVGAQAAIWDQLRAARAAGLAMLLVSADLEELIGLSDRIVVLYRAALVATLLPREVTPEILGSYMTGAALGPETS
jgi:simple sugar transport system ATP-binding protein